MFPEPTSPASRDKAFWRQARKHINDQEDRVAEVQLDLTRERTALTEANSSLTQIQEGVAQLTERKDAASTIANQLRIQILESQKQSRILSDEANGRAQQNQLMHQDFSTVQAAQLHMRKLYGKHLDEQNAVIEGYSKHFAARQKFGEHI